ncbi:MAG: RHS repeat-associated core domain-containing protein, partial [Actinomycetota bacterium]
DGLRTSKTVAGQTKPFSWDESGPVPLVLSDGELRFVYGPGGRPLYQLDAADVPTYLHQDQVGSTRQLTSATGEVVATFTYGPYGELSSATGTATTPLRFAGEYTDTETGFVYLRARYYDPATGQFISRDPLTALTGEPYLYAAGNPINAIDPLGLLSLRDVTRAVKKVAGTISVVSSAAAAVAYTTALVCGPVALRSGTALAAGAFFSATSAVTGAVATAIECTDGGGLDKACVAGIASTAINALVPRVGRGITTRFGEELGNRATAALANLGFSTNTAGLLWGKQASRDRGGADLAEGADWCPV